MTKSKSKPAKISPEQAAAILQAEQDQRLQKFNEAYQVLCKKYKCEIVAQPGLTADGRIGANLLATISREEEA